MNSRQLKYVLMVAQERNFTEAARKLYITQPSLSQYIQNLEKEIGVQLFERSITPLQLTIAGKAYVEMARRVLDLENQFDTHLKDIIDEQYGKLVVGATTFRSLQILPKVIKAFTESYPNYEIEVRDQAPVVLIDMLDKGEIDLCITKIPDNTKKYNAVYIMTEELLLAVPKNHPVNAELKILRELRPGISFPVIDLADLKGISLVTTNRNEQHYREVESLFKQVGFMPRVIVECDSSELCHEMVCKGVGAAIIQSTHIRSPYLSEWIRYYAIHQDYPSLHLVALFRKHQYISHALRCFIDLIKSK